MQKSEVLFLMPHSRALGVWLFPLRFNSPNCPIAVAAVCPFCRERKLRLRSTHDLANLTQWIFSEVWTCTWIHKPIEDQSETLAWSMWSHRRQRTSCRVQRGCLPHRPGPWQVTENSAPLPQPQPVKYVCVPGMRCSRQESRPSGWGNVFVLWEGGGGG